MRRVVFIDGENLKGYLRRIVFERVAKIRFDSYDLKGLIGTTLDAPATERRFYFAKVRPHPDTPEVVQPLLASYRALHGHLHRQGFTLARASNVRPDYTGKRGEKRRFREKGVEYIWQSIWCPWGVEAICRTPICLLLTPTINPRCTSYRAAA